MDARAIVFFAPSFFCDDAAEYIQFVVVGRAYEKVGVLHARFFKHACARAVADDAFYVKFVDCVFDFLRVDVDDHNVVTFVDKFLHKSRAHRSETADDNFHISPFGRF